MNEEPLYCVRFRRSDGTEAWLGQHGCGAADDEREAAVMRLSVARRTAEERNVFYGHARNYWLVRAAIRSRTTKQEGRTP
jgi:hypothetical protein